MFNAFKHTAFTDRLLRRPPFLHARLMRQVRSADALSFAQRKSVAEAALAKVLARARTLPAYARVPAATPFSDWPILFKQDILGKEELLTPPRFLPAPKAETGGTTGQPLRFVRTIKNIVREQALLDHLCASRGINFRKARVAVLRGDSLANLRTDDGIYWRDEGKRKRVYSAHHICPDTVAHYINSLRSYQPDVLFCYPSSLASLLSGTEQLDGLRIPLVIASSEVLPLELCDRARLRLGCDVIDFYGHAERIVSAYAVNGREYYFQPGYGHVELLPCGNGRAHIVATSLDTDGPVFVRYETGDVALTGTDDPELLEQMAYGCTPFLGIEGRESEYVELSDGRRIIGLNHIPRGADGAATVQLHASAVDCIDIYIVPDDGFSPISCQRIVENFYAKFPRNVTVRLWRVQSPLRQPNGKAPLLLRLPQIPGGRSLILDSTPADRAA